LTEFGKTELHELMQRGGDGILGLGFVDESTAEGFVSLDETGEGLAGVEIDEAFEARDAFGEGGSGHEDEEFLFAEE
jgi:hypothetical protein